MQAMAWNTPLVSFRDPLTNWGQCLRPVIESREGTAEERAEIADRFALGSGREVLAWVETAEDFAAMVRRLADDAAFRADVAAAGRDFTERYFGRPDDAAARLAGVIRAIITAAKN